MNTTTLNMTTLDGGVIIKKGGGGGGTTINNQDKVVDITENGTTEVVADGGYTGLGKVTINTEVEGAKPKWTGHADAEGLKAIGWTDDDIAYYQENGVNWNEEDDQYHLVSDDNKALYGVLTANNISTYKNRIVYLPKIDTSGMTSMASMFRDCFLLVAIPQLNTSNVTSMKSMFSYCYSLTTIPMLDTSNVTNMDNMFNECRSLKAIHMFDTSKVTSMNYTFQYCNSLQAIHMLDTSKVTSMSHTFGYCHSLTTIPMLDTSKVTVNYNVFSACTSLTVANIKNVNRAYELGAAALLSKESLLYLINNEAAESAITITLASYAYERLANDADVVAALANHSNITLASA